MSIRLEQINPGPDTGFIRKNWQPEELSVSREALPEDPIEKSEEEEFIIPRITHHTLLLFTLPHSLFTLKDLETLTLGQDLDWNIPGRFNSLV